MLKNTKKILQSFWVRRVEDNEREGACFLTLLECFWLISYEIFLFIFHIFHCYIFSGTMPDVFLNHRIPMVKINCFGHLSAAASLCHVCPSVMFTTQGLFASPHSAHSGFSTTRFSLGCNCAMNWSSVNSWNSRTRTSRKRKQHAIPI